jgi:hypothetical protein
MKRTNLIFAEKLTKLRLSASMIYDRGRASGHSHEELMEGVKPLMDELHKMSLHAVKHDLGDVICAIQFLKAEADKHDRDARFLIQKSVDTKEHAIRLENMIKNEMETKGLSEMGDGDFFATLVDGILTIR